MVSSSKDMDNRQVEEVLSRINERSYKSRRDQCYVMLVKCAKCNRAFEEEVGSFRDKIIARSDLLCLSCDPDAVEPSFVGVTIRLGWFR